MEAIKHSRIIVVLLILYIGISIIVVTLDNSSKKKNDDKSGTSNTTNKKYDKFISEVDNINTEIYKFYSDRQMVTDVCIPISYVMGDTYSGSAYVSEDGESIKMWYSNGTYAINNIETNKDRVIDEDIEESYTTEYYNNCGLNQ